MKKRQIKKIENALYEAKSDIKSLCRYVAVLKVVCPEVFKEYAESKGIRYDYFGVLKIGIDTCTPSK